MEHLVEKEILSELECPVCRDTFKDPRVLPCKHTMCRDCISDLIHNELIRTSRTSREREKNFRCPIDRKEFPIPKESGNWGHSYPQNRFASFTLATLERFKEVPLCETHNSKMKEYYCFHHELFVCGPCSLSDHKELPCECVTVDDAKEKTVVEMKRLLHELKQRRTESERFLRAEMHKRSNQKEENLRIIREARSQLDSLYQTMNAKLDEVQKKIEEKDLAQQSRESSMEGNLSEMNKIEQYFESLLFRPIEELAPTILPQRRPFEEQIRMAGVIIRNYEKSVSHIKYSVSDAFRKAVLFKGKPVKRQAVAANNSINASDPLNSNARLTYRRSLSKMEILHEKTMADLKKNSTVTMTTEKKMTLSNCCDILVATDYVLCIVDELVQKRDISDLKLLHSHKFPNAIKLCNIGQVNKYGVLQTNKCISIFTVDRSVSGALYEVQITKAYTCVCYNSVKSGNNLDIFYASYTPEAKVDCIDRLWVFRCPTSIPSAEHRMKVGPLASNKGIKELYGISDLAFAGNLMIVGTISSVVCLDDSGMCKWKVSQFSQAVTGVFACNEIILACVQNSQKISVLDINGRIIHENILSLTNDVSPTSASFNKQVFLYSEFNSDTWRRDVYITSLPSSLQMHCTL